MFRSTPPREGRPGRWRGWHRYRSFDPRPHARGDVRLWQWIIGRFLVSIHAPTRGATALGSTREMAAATSCFDPRPHARGDLRSGSPSSSATLLFRSTPPREGRRHHVTCWSARLRVSIHAPTRGATYPRSFAVRLRKFRSTPPREGRRRAILAILDQGGARVSIHAPTRGAT